jgi:hypothetical protein
LIRHGRARQFTWSPSAEERREIIAHLFPELNYDEVCSLVKSYTDEPVSFFAQLRQEIYYDFVSDVVFSDNPAFRLRQAVARGPADRMQIKVSLNLLLAAASRLTEAAAKGGNFLEVRQ